MSLLVQKYGGTSVDGPERIRAVARRVAAARAAGHDTVVVVSAMGQTTDELIALARQVSERPSRRELDMLLTTGERVSMALLAMALHDLGVEAISFTGSQSGILTDDAHSAARIVDVRPERIRAELERGRGVIVAGFQGVSPRTKEITPLGRITALLSVRSAEIAGLTSDPTNIGNNSNDYTGFTNDDGVAYIDENGLFLQEDTAPATLAGWGVFFTLAGTGATNHPSFLDGAGTSFQLDNAIEYCTVQIENATTSDDIMCGKAAGAITITDFNCVATGAVDPVALVLEVVECTSAGASCAQSGMTVTVEDLVTTYNDATATDAAIDSGDWFGISTISLTTSPLWVSCQLAYKPTI